MSDVYDRLRPADEHLDAQTAARVWARVAGEHHDAGVTPAGGGPSMRIEGAPSSRGGPPRRRAAYWAVAAAMLGLIALSAVATTRTISTTPSDEPPPTPGVTTAPTTSEIVTERRGVPSTTIASLSGGPVDLNAGSRFALADVLPEGWLIDHLEAVPGGSILGSQRWAQLGADGTVTGVLSVRPPRPLTADQVDITTEEYDSTVRGVPASEWNDAPQNGAPAPRAGISWVESGFQMQVEATGTARELVRPIAEGLAFDVSSRGVSIPVDLGLVPADELGLADPAAVATTIGITPPSSLGGGLSVRAEPNTFAADLDELIVDHLDWQPIEIDGTDARVARSAEGAIVGATWLDGDMHVLVTSTSALADEDVIDTLRGIRFTTAREFRTAGARLTERTIATITDWEVYDRITTADGIEITIRSRPGSEGANGICIEAPVLDCRENVSDGGIAQGFEATAAAGFSIDGAAVGVTWIAADDAATPLGAPTLRPSDVLNVDDGMRDGTTASILVDEMTERGRFVLVDIPDSERPPTIVFAGDPGRPAFELTPAIPSPFSF